MFRLWRLHRFRNSYMIRGALVWIALRVGIGFLRSLAPGSVSALGPSARVALVGVVVVAVLVDARRRREDVFFGNLGISQAQVGAVVVPAPLVLELGALPLIVGAVGL